MNRTGKPGTVHAIQRLPHQPMNPGATDVAIAIVARNEANEQESVKVYKPFE